MKEKIVKQIEQKLDELNTDIKELKKYKNANNKAIDVLKTYIEHPDEIDKTFLDQIISDNIKDSLNYKQSLVLIGYYENESFNKESQIISSRNYISELLDSKVKDFSEKVNELNKKIEENQSKINETKKIYNTLLNYDENTYLDENQIISIYNFISKMEPSSDVLKFFTQLAINNAELSLGPQLRIRENQTLDKYKNSLEALYTNRSEDYSYFEGKEFTLNVFNNVIGEYLSKLHSIDDEDFDILLELNSGNNPEINLEELLDDKSFYYIAACILLLDAHKNKDINKVEMYLNTLFHKEFLDDYEKLSLLGLDEYTDKLNRIKKYILNDEEFSSLDQNINALSKEGYNPDGIMMNLGLSKKKYESYLVTFKYRRIISVLNNSKLSLATKKIVQEEIDLLEEYLNNLENSLGQETEKIDDKSINNFVIFLDPEHLDEKLNEVMTNTRASESYKSLLGVLEKIMYVPDSDLHSMSRNIHEDHGKKNKYDIRALGNNVMIGFKRLEVIDSNRPVYVILSVANGKDLKKGQNSSKLTSELNDSISLFESKFREYLEIKDAFDNDKADEYLKISNIFIEEIRKKSMGEKTI